MTDNSEQVTNERKQQLLSNRVGPEAQDRVQAESNAFMAFIGSSMIVKGICALEWIALDWT
jgi:hypothetical protein